MKTNLRLLLILFLTLFSFPLLIFAENQDPATSETETETTVNEKTENETDDDNNTGEAGENSGGEEENLEEQESKPTYSGTLPVIFITTEDSQPVVTKDYYINATYYLDPMGTDFEAIGSVESPLPTEIKGRGNSTWQQPKKPYKLKLGKKQSMLGMPKSKHWALIAHFGYSKWCEDYIGFELGRHLELGWVPHMKPVEVVMNGEYIGMYFMTETVRIETGRLEIFEQPDEEADPEIVPGGWLVEIDNYPDPCQIILQEDEARRLRITYHSPEILSDVQNQWLTNEFTTINSLIYCEDKTNNEWENYIDALSLAKYFVQREVMDDTDGFLGSFYLHKDAGSDTKWVAGPLWDCTSRNRIKTDFTPNMPGWGEGFTIYNRPNWIRELLKFPHFMNLIHEVCEQYCMGDMTIFTNMLSEFGTPLEDAANANYAVWPDEHPGTSSKIKFTSKWFLSNAEWFVNRMSMKVNQLEISDNFLKINIGDTYKITASFAPEDTVDPLAWGSTDNAVATVSQSGEVTGLAPGFATIFAICGDKRVECLVQCGDQVDAPEIKIINNQLIITSSHPDARIHTSIVADDHQEIEHDNGEPIELSGSYIVTSYATAHNMIKSGSSTATLLWLPNESTPTSVLTTTTDHGVIIKSVGDNIVILGTHKGDDIILYSLEGLELYKGKAFDGESTIPIIANTGTIYIVSINGVSVKYLFR